MASFSNRDMFETDRPHFFKVILDETIHDKKLGIPRRFVRKYGKDLSSPAVLEVPSGRTWQVELMKWDDEIWLQNGWQEFLEYYSLTHGFFLVFEYTKRNCHFNVIIFDKSASEIDYPINVVTNGDLLEGIQKPKIIQETARDSDSSAETLDDFIPCRKRKEKSPLPSPLPHKMMKVENPTGNTALHFPGKQDEGKRVDGEISGQKQTSDTIVLRKKPLEAKEKNEALRRASINFKSKNPFFLVAMQPSYVHPAVKLNIQARFAVKYFPKKQQCGDATLHGLDGRSWPVKFYLYNIAYNGKRMAKISQGWRNFAKDNHLEVGDVCAFELIMIKSSKATFQVTIFRHNRGKKQKLKDEESNSPEAIEAAKSFTSVHPFFKVVISPGSVENSNMCVPMKFISNMKQSTEKVKLQIENRWWLVKLNLYPQLGKGKFTDGWSAFVRGNSLKVGDVCIFELNNSENLQLKVTIFRNVK